MTRSELDEDALAGIRLKLLRAYGHLDALNREVAAFIDRHPFDAFPAQVDANGTEHVFHLRMLESIPVRWGVLLGEAVHDLRSALDHVVYQLTLDWNGVEIPRTGFPLLTDPSKWRKTARVSVKNPSGIDPNCGFFQIRGVGPGPQAFIESLQPYPTRQGSPHEVLLDLHEFWNQDKHRLLHIWGVQFGADFSNMSVPGAKGNWSFAAEPGVLKHGAKAFTVTFAEPNPDVQINGSMPAAVTFQSPSGPGGGAAAGSLMRLWDATVGIAGLLLASLGHQNDPMP